MEPSQNPRLPQTTRPRLFSGWRFGVTVCGVTAIFVFIINVTVTIWVAANPRFPMRNGHGLLYRGSCSTSKHATIWLHLAINILSTLLLGAGNYCVQFLSSPTRHEVDRAHADKRWLHIGVQSFKNLGAIGRDRLILWLILAASSLPLQLVSVHTLLIPPPVNYGICWSYYATASTRSYSQPYKQTSISSWRHLKIL